MSNIKGIYFTPVRVRKIEIGQPVKDILMGARVSYIPVDTELLKKTKELYFAEKKTKRLAITPVIKKMVIGPSVSKITVGETEKIKHLFLGLTTKEIALGPETKNLFLGLKVKKIYVPENLQHEYIYLTDDFGNILKDDNSNLLTEN